MEGRAGIEPATSEVSARRRAPCPFAAVQPYPQRESNPRRRCERAVSWSARRWGPVGTLERPLAAPPGIEPGSPGPKTGVLPLDDGALAPEGSALRNQVRERLRGVGRNEVADSGELFEMLLVLKFGADHVGPSFLMF